MKGIILLSLFFTVAGCATRGPANDSEKDKKDQKEVRTPSSQIWQFQPDLSRH